MANLSASSAQLIDTTLNSSLRVAFLAIVTIEAMTDSEWHERFLAPGSVLSFSGRSADPFKFRRVNTAGPDRFGAVLNAFPHLRRFFADGQPPIVVNHYPAALGPLPSAIVIDTYLRRQNFARALHLAQATNRTAIILGQPLALADFIQSASATETPMPRRVLIAAGGYSCPWSLEVFLLQVLKQAGSTCELIHAYDVAEVEYGIFVGTRNPQTGHVVYRHVATQIDWNIESGKLRLRDISTAEWIETGDLAWITADGGLQIGLTEERASASILATLEKWSISDWSRRTGYLARTQGNLLFQCREHVAPTSPDEQEFFAFARQTGMSFLDKPVWQ